MSKQECCKSCGDKESCTMVVTGYRRFSFEGQPGATLFETEDEGWDTGDTKYDGSFEVYPICEERDTDFNIEAGRYMEMYDD